MLFLRYLVGQDIVKQVLRIFASFSFECILRRVTGSDGPWQSGRVCIRGLSRHHTDSEPGPEAAGYRPSAARGPCSWWQPPSGRFSSCSGLLTGKIFCKAVTPAASAGDSYSICSFQSCSMASGTVTCVHSHCLCSLMVSLS